MRLRTLVTGTASSTHYKVLCSAVCLKEKVIYSTPTAEEAAQLFIINSCDPQQPSKKRHY